MVFSVKRLRIWLLAGAALLVLVIAGFLGYARYRTHRFLAGLPGKLGIDIRRETNGYTYSQSVKGKTVMTLHAAKAIEHKDGKLTLHDVGMILYGRKQDRADRISGSEFEYDTASGVVRAVGEVHIDLQAPPAAGSHAKDARPRPDPGNAAIPIVGVDEENEHAIHVQTSGLVYLQKLGVAATDQDVEFKFGGMTGHAIGAEYNSDTGVLILQAAVKTNGIQKGRPVVLTASHAELERTTQRALLTQARYVSTGQTIRGDHAIVHLRSDGSPERIEAEGNVILEGPASGSVAAPRADVLLNAASQAQSAHLFGEGGVRYESISSLREGKGQAQDARIAFDAVGRPEHIVLTGAVHIHERARAANAASAFWSVREATAGTMTFALADDGTGKGKALRQVEAHTGAHMTLMTDADTIASSTSELAGDLLRGHFTGAGRSAVLSEVHGTGHTSLRRINGQGAEQTSAGDTLDVALRPASKRPHSQKSAGSEEIARAVQTGHVVLTSKGAPTIRDATPATTKALADLAIYDGDADHLTLTGHAQVVDEGSTVSANQIILEHTSGDATAEGAVKANYLQPGASEPVHVLADHALLQHAAQRALFYGGARPARMWQGASQVEAPLLELDQKKRQLTAHGATADAGSAVVHAVLVGNGAAKPGAVARPSVVRVASRTMVYQDGARQVEFAGGVKVEDADGVLTAREAIAYLQHRTDAAPATGSEASKKDQSKETSGVFFGGSVERIVANGRIEMDQPGRRAAGEQLVYTASDGLFVLTGSPSALPKLIDEVQGTVTGTSLRFHTGDDSVMVTGEAGSPSQRVHTVTRVKQK